MGEGGMGGAAAETAQVFGTGAARRGPGVGRAVLSSINQYYNL
jgi:hypothetical protein